MNKAGIKQQANTALALSSVGILAAFPFQHTFIGGLVFAAFSAATIGGLADSFAISALFGNPLKIPWPRWLGTHIISRNRERLIGELVTMVEHELLTVDNIRDKLDQYDFAVVILRYLKDNDGAEDINAILQKLTSEVLTKVDIDELASNIGTFLLDHADTLQVSDIVADIGDWTIRNHYDDRIVDFLIAQFIKLAESAKFRGIIEEILQSAIRSYEGDKLSRKMVNFTAGLNAASISERIQTWLISFLQQFNSADNVQRRQLQEQIATFVQRLRTDEGLRYRLEQSKLKLIDNIKEEVKLNTFISERLHSFRETALLNKSGEDHFPWIRQKVEESITKLDNPNALARLDKLIKSTLMSWIEQKHAFIGRTVQEKLNTFTEEELIELVKDKAGQDLQYIRLNGIIVGAFVGAVLYLTTFWIGGI